MMDSEMEAQIRQLLEEISAMIKFKINAGTISMNAARRVLNSLGLYPTLEEQ